MLWLTLVAIAATPTAVEWKGTLVATDGKTVKAWSMPKLEPVNAFASKLPIEAVARDERSLWAFSSGATFRWSGTGWDAMPTHGAKGPCLAYAVVDGAPVGLCGTLVHRFSDGATWPGPKFADQIRGEGFGGLHVVASHGSQLAIGTGFGEWGGYLWLLDLKTGTWSHFYDELHYVNGLAWNGKGWTVAWSMSHFDASTQVREHRPDATVLRAGPDFDKTYLRTLASSPTGVIGVEEQRVVRVTAKLELEAMRDLTGEVLYGPESHAVGVASGITALIPSGDDPVLVTETELRLASGRVLMSATP
jgi:hypothetical protein